MHKDFGAVCAVRTDRGQAHGVFISPKRVLTNWHVVQGAKSVRVINDAGMTSEMKPTSEGGQHRRETSLDLAVIELKQPIGDDFALPPTGRASGSFLEDNKGVLKSRFDGVRQLHPVAYNPFGAMRGATANDTLTTFHTDIKLIPGYSGSPIFEEDGVTLLSVVSAADLAAQRRAAEFNDIFSGLGGSRASTPPIKGHLPFLAVRTDLFARWFKSMASELNI